MKKKFITAATAALLLLTTVTTPSCIGSFSLTNRLMSWNQHVGDKFLNELVFFAFWVLPVYEVTALADVVVLNSIEFWSGTNPVEASTKVIEGNDGRYLVKCDGKGYDIISLNDDSKVRLDFDVDSQTWSYNIDGNIKPIFTFIDANHIQLPTNADPVVVEISKAGLWAYSNDIKAPADLM